MKTEISTEWNSFNPPAHQDPSPTTNLDIIIISQVVMLSAFQKMLFQYYCCNARPATLAYFCPTSMFKPHKVPYQGAKNAVARWTPGQLGSGAENNTASPHRKHTILCIVWWCSLSVQFSGGTFTDLFSSFCSTGNCHFTHFWQEQSLLSLSPFSNLCHAHVKLFEHILFMAKKSGFSCFHVQMMLKNQVTLAELSACKPTDWNVSWSVYSSVQLCDKST